MMGKSGGGTRRRGYSVRILVFYNGREEPLYQNLCSLVISGPEPPQVFF